MASAIVHKTDRFNGVLIDVSKQTVALEEFVEKLKGAMVEWKSADMRGVWLTLQTSQSVLVPQLTQIGFDFHHAEPGFVCLTKWLPGDVPNHIPGYANHYLGVAGFVVNDQNQLLVIREKYHIRGGVSIWKLPGGLADAGEDLNQTARREVLEETGVDSEFICVIAYRHMHNYRHGCSDFYQVCLMKPLTSEINACPMEIADCRWMDLDEYESLPEVSDINRYFVRKYREIKASGVAIGAEKVLSYDNKSLQNCYGVQKVQLSGATGGESPAVTDGSGS